MKCVFCDQEVHPDAKVQHIIPAGVGGSLGTKDVTCTSCNEYFGSNLDPQFMRKYQVLLNAMPPELFQGYDPPRLEAEDVRGERFYSLPGQRREDARAEYTRNLAGDEIHVQAPNEELLRRIIREQGWGDRAIISPDWSEPGQVLFEIEPFYSPVHDRLAAKILLECLDYVLIGVPCRTHVRDGGLSDAAKWVRNGQASAMHSPKSKALLKVSAKRWIDEAFSSAGAPSSPFPHRIILLTAPEPNQSTLIGLVQVLGFEVYGVVLTEAWKGKPLAKLYQRSMLKDTEPSWWSSEFPKKPLTTNDLVGLRVTDVQQPLDSFQSVQVRLIDYREDKADEFLSDEFAFALRRYDGGNGDLDQAHVGNVFKIRLERMFAHQMEAWRESWPRIEKELLGRLPRHRLPAVETQKRDLIRSTFLSSYRDAYSLCRKHIGLPSNFTYSRTAPV